MGGNIFKSLVAWVTLSAFLLTSAAPAFAQQGLVMPAPGTMVGLSAASLPAVLRGIKVYAHEPMRLDFILDNGDIAGNGRARSLQDETTRLVKYFMAALTVPENDLWVNLSPYEKDRIVPEAFGRTEMGRDLLAQDYLLKQITASVIYPEGETGKKFWAEVYKKAQEKYGTTDIPMDTFNKVWIVPAQAVVYERRPARSEGSQDPAISRPSGPRNDVAAAYINEARLKVMLETDYLATQAGEGEALEGARHAVPVQTEILRTIVIPLLEKEVNEGANFAPLRQVYHSLILATWYKKKIKGALLTKAFADQRKIAGLGYTPLPAGGHDATQGIVSPGTLPTPQGLNPKATQVSTVADPTFVNSPEDIWQLYVEAFKKGAYNYIKEEQDGHSGELIPRKYFSGGVNFGDNFAQKIETAAAVSSDHGVLQEISVRVAAAGGTKAAPKRIQQVLTRASVALLAGVMAGCAVIKPPAESEFLRNKKIIAGQRINIGGTLIDVRYFQPGSARPGPAGTQILGTNRIYIDTLFALREKFEHIGKSEDMHRRNLLSTVFHESIHVRVPVMEDDPRVPVVHRYVYGQPFSSRVLKQFPRFSDDARFDHKVAEEFVAVLGEIAAAREFRDWRGGTWLVAGYYRDLSREPAEIRSPLFYDFLAKIFFESVFQALPSDPGAREVLVTRAWPRVRAAALTLGRDLYGADLAGMESLSLSPDLLRAISRFHATLKEPAGDKAQAGDQENAARVFKGPFKRAMLRLPKQTHERLRHFRKAGVNATISQAPAELKGGLDVYAAALKAYSLEALGNEWAGLFRDPIVLEKMWQTRPDAMGIEALADAIAFFESDPNSVSHMVSVAELANLFLISFMGPDYVARLFRMSLLFREILDRWDAADAAMRVPNEDAVRELVGKGWFREAGRGNNSFAAVYEDRTEGSPLADYVVKVPMARFSERSLQRIKDSMGGIMADFNTVSDVSINGVPYPFVVIQKKMKVFSGGRLGDIGEYTLPDGRVVDPGALEKELVVAMIVRGIYYPDALIAKNYGLNETTGKLCLIDFGDARVAGRDDPLFSSEIFRPYDPKTFWRQKNSRWEFYKDSGEGRYFDRIGVPDNDVLYAQWGTRLQENYPVPDVLIGPARPDTAPSGDPAMQDRAGSHAIIQILMKYFPKGDARPKLTIENLDRARDAILSAEAQAVVAGIRGHLAAVFQDLPSGSGLDLRILDAARVLVVPHAPVHVGVMQGKNGAVRIVFNKAVWEMLQTHPDVRDLVVGHELGHVLLDPVIGRMPDMDQETRAYIAIRKLEEKLADIVGVMGLSVDPLDSLLQRDDPYAVLREHDTTIASSADLYWSGDGSTYPEAAYEKDIYMPDRERSVYLRMLMGQPDSVLLEKMQKETATLVSLLRPENNGTGGIDLTAAGLNVETKSSGAPLQFIRDPAQLQEILNAPGLTPVIIGVREIQDLPAFLSAS